MARITNLELVSSFKKYLDDGWGYVYGGQGELYTKELAEKWKKEKRPTPNKSWNVETYFTESCARWFGKHVADCSGGIVYTIKKYDPYFSDRTAAAFKDQFTEWGTMDTLPEITGLGLWYKGHIGIYIGNGEAIEFRGTNYGCVKTKIKDRSWKLWGKIYGVEYKLKEVCKVNLNIIKKGSEGEQVRTLQILLNAHGFSCDADGIAGAKTETAIKKFQSKNKLTADGIAGQKTWSRLINGNDE